MRPSVYSSSHFNALSMFPLFPENRKSSPLILCGKNLFKMYPSRFLFILGKLNKRDKIPIRCNVKFESVFTAETIQQ